MNPGNPLMAWQTAKDMPIKELIQFVDTYVKLEKSKASNR